MRRALALALIAFGLGAAQARANTTSCQPDAPVAASARVVPGELDGLRFNVLLPSGYASSARRYPVLYLLHGADYNENTWLRQTDLESFTGSFSDERAAIVVLPDGGPMGFYTDWYQGDEQWETYHLRRLIPYVDAHFRTLADRAHRAIAGFSFGGFGAVHYAARHPELFVAAGSFSGLDDLTYPEAPYEPADPAPTPGAGSPGPPRPAPAPAPYHPPTDAGSGCGPQQGSAFGDPVSDRTVWHAHNPADLAPSLRATTVYASAGNGVPCGPEDAAGEPSYAVGIEPGIRRLTEAFLGALSDAGVPHIADLRDCGLHDQASAQRSLHAFWPVMVQAFGRRPPARFDLRTADADAEAWGWSFVADARRALEFLDVRGASAAGVTVTGSGSETIVTARLFRPGERVGVTGAAPARTRADAGGRVHVVVDLGPPHGQAQFAPGAPAATFVTRKVMFKRLRQAGQRPRGTGTVHP